MLNTAKQELTNPIIPVCGGGSLSEDEQRILSYYHSISRSMTLDTQNVNEPRYKSAHNVRVDELWGSTITPCTTFDAASAQTLTNSAITLHYQVELTKVPNSNGQSYYYNDGFRFVRPWVGPTDVAFPNTNLPSDGFTLLLYRGDDATKGIPGSLIGSMLGAWVTEYYAGIIHFSKDHTPYDLGWGTIKATFFEYTGVFGVPGVTDSFTTVGFDSGTSTLTFNSGETSETSIVISNGGGSSLTIEDENNVVLTGVTVINFMGIGVAAQSAVSGTTRRVNVFIPPPEYVSHFNTTDGSTTATIPSISTTNRYVALPTIEGTPYKIGSWAGGTIHPTIRNNVTTLTYTTNGSFSILNTSTTFSAILFDANGTSPLRSHTIILNGNGAVTVQNITITVSGWGVDSDRYKATVSVSIPISTVLVSGGRFSVRLTHNNGIDGTYTFSQNDMFRDTELTSVSLSGTLTVLPQAPVIKQISGVYTYTTGTQWHVNLPNINNLNSISYPTTRQFSIDDTNFFISETINAHGEGGSFDTFSSGWNRQFNNSGAIYDKLDWITDITDSTNWIHSGGISNNLATATAYDWSLVSTKVSGSYNYFIDTFVDLSDRNSEMFRTEVNPSFPRLQSNLTTPWDETTGLNVTDGGTGLQVLADRLVYPKYDFNYEPNISSQPNYVGLSGDKYYYRRFNTNGNTISNGRILFSDYNIVESDLLSNNVKFEITIDNGDTWYTLNVEYDGYPIVNGSGCRINPDLYGLGVGTINTNSLAFTLADGFSDYLYLKITFTSSSSSKYIGGLDFVDGNWI